MDSQAKSTSRQMDLTKDPATESWTHSSPRSLWFAHAACTNPVQRGLEPPVQEFYFKGTKLGTQMFLQLAELAEQPLDQIRVLNAGRGLWEQLVQPTHSTDKETEAKEAVSWHT